MGGMGVQYLLKGNCTLGTFLLMAWMTRQVISITVDSATCIQFIKALRESEATTEHLVNISNVEIATTCEVSQPNSQLKIRVHRLAAASDGFLLVPLQFMPDGVKETAIVWTLHSKAALKLLVCQVHDVDHRTEPVPVHVGGSVSRHFGLYLRRTHHKDQKELLTPRQRRHSERTGGGLYQKLLSSYLHFALFAYEIEQGLNEGHLVSLLSDSCRRPAVPPLHRSRRRTKTEL
jgi:hypothetical protein